MYFIINSLLHSVQANRANIDTHNLVNYSILPYNISTFEFNGNAWVLGPEMENDNGDVDDNDVEQNKFRMGNNPSTIMDQYLGGEELEELILEGGIVSDNNLA